MDDSSKILELKEQLAAELAKTNSDNTLILSLSTEISKLDKEAIRFSVDAGIINRLGKELVGRHETAVSELVKNAYDADAVEVELIFENAWTGNGTLFIKDNGLGMTREQLINGFMRLSSADKLHNPVSERYKRVRAGRKGIGRFATQRLGNKLTIVTQTLDSDIAIKITINWDDFETDKDLLSVANQIELVEKTKAEGTDLIIQGLREGWSDAMIKRVYRYTADLLQPFPLSKKRKKEEKDRTDPGFSSVYYRKEDKSLIKIVDEEEAFFKHALAEIEGYILDDGQGCWALKSEKLEFKEDIFLIGKERDKDSSKFQFVRNIHFKCYYFIYDASLLPPQSLTFIREVASERGGIRLYRNGFRVLPYGEKGNDWLRLDESVRKRQILTPHANNNFFGFVEITDKEGKLFEETSSREGLIENEALNELEDFVYRSIVSATLKVAELRGRKATSSQKEWKPEENPTEQVDAAISDLESYIGSNENSDESGSSKSEKFRDVVLKLKEGREKEKEKYEAHQKQLLDEINMLRILAGLGLVIGEFVHEVKRFLPAFDSDTVFLKEAVKDYAEGLKRAERLETNLKSFTAYTAYFDKAISQNVLREIRPIDLIDAVNDFEKVIDNDISRSKIKYHKAVFKEYDLYTTPMHPSEWASILFNLYTNSKKAIKRAQSEKNLLITCGREGNNVFLEFSDDGDGIPKENEEVIFNAFFTTSSAAGYNANENEALTGTGLGLKIIKDIIESYGGSIYVTTPEENFKTTMRIEIPANK
ncbi:MAG: histidine kinase [Bacteroidetes bacterium]|nr:histidine kinase [Bacteroidota bacterium]